MDTRLVSMKLGTDALGVVLLDAKISDWLKANDPKAFEQCEKARIAMLTDRHHPEHLNEGSNVTKIRFDFGAQKRKTFDLTYHQAITAVFALRNYINLLQAEIKNPTRAHGPAEAAAALCDAQPLSELLNTWLLENRGTK
jgi:hypothetical protein